MLRRMLKLVLSLVLFLALAVGGLLLYNATPEVPAISAAEAAAPTKPFVVRLHAQWCPICMATRSEWAEIAETYEGRVNLAVFDATSNATRARSRIEAERLGLEGIVDAYYGATGMVLVIDPLTREVVGRIAGIHGFDTYRTAIDAALSPPPRG